ncbi:MAG: CaiB/BaiF CoA transferase family protein [Rubrivivax sp.]
MTAAAGGPLQGMRVIELAAIGPVPLCGQLLSDLGAEVILVDRIAASGLGLEMARRHETNLRNRRSLAVDTRQPEGRDLVLHLLQGADVLLEGFRPGVAERLGLGPADAERVNPRLVYGRMTGFGQQGPLSQQAGHDLNYIALTGALHAIGPAGGAPVPPLNLVGDYGGGALYLAFGVMAALFERQRSGLGQVVDAAMVDGAASLMGIFFGLKAAGQWQPGRGRNLLDGGAPFYACYETADGGWLSVAPLEPKFFAEFVRLSGLDTSWCTRQYQPQAWPELRAEITACVKRRTRAEWETLFQGSDACVAPVLSLDEVDGHPHAQARDAFVALDGITQPAAAPRFSRSGAAPLTPPPEPGADTDAILQGAGCSADQVARWRAAGVVA